MVIREMTAYASIPGAEWRRPGASFRPVFYRIHLDQMTGHHATPTKAPEP
jgi:hypothetical protein